MEHLELVRAGAAAAVVGAAHADGGVDLARVDGAAGLEPGVELFEDGGGAVAVAVLSDHREAVAAPQDLDRELVLDLREVAVEFTAEIDEKAIVREFEEGFLNVGGGGRVERADTRLRV